MIKTIKKLSIVLGVLALAITIVPVNSAQAVLTLAATTATAVSIDIPSAATTGNAIDITSSGIFTNDLIDINVGAQAATGDVMNIALGATAVAAQALVVDSAGASSTDGWVLSGDNSGNGIWTGDMINLRSGTGEDRKSVV